MITCLNNWLSTSFLYRQNNRLAWVLVGVDQKASKIGSTVVKLHNR
jgi:hypothetical protein